MKNSKVPFFKHLLLDLDGTLLGLCMEEFIPAMVESMQRHFRGLLSAGDFSYALQEGFRSMVSKKEEAGTVLEAFLESFCRMTGMPSEEVVSCFDGFYRGPFRELRRLTAVVEGAAELVGAAAERGLCLTLATNPIFPRVAISERLAWAGLKEESFRLVTDAEKMHFCKPHPAYFREIMDLLGAAPDECLMAGNDACQDMAAGKVGISTFLVKSDSRAESGDDDSADYEGTLGELSGFLRATGRGNQGRGRGAR